MKDPDKAERHAQDLLDLGFPRRVAASAGRALGNGLFDEPGVSQPPSAEAASFSDDVPVVVSIADRADFEATAALAEKAGLEVERTLDVIRVLVGTVPRTSLAALGVVPGVDSVEEGSGIEAVRERNASSEQDRDRGVR